MMLVVMDVFEVGYYAVWSYKRAAVQQGGDLIHALWSSAHIGSALVFCSVPILFNHRVRVCGGEQCICVCWVGIVCEARTDNNEEDGHLSRSRRV